MDLKLSFEKKLILSNLCVYYVHCKYYYQRIYYPVLLLDPACLFGTPGYSKAPIIRTGTYASSAVHAMYFRTGPRYGTYNRNFRVQTLVLKLFPYLFPIKLMYGCFHYCTQSLSRMSEKYSNPPQSSILRSLYDNKIHTLENGTFRGLGSLQTL
jgi:hypothetical protein